MAKNLLYRFDDPTRKPDLSRLGDHSRFGHPRYQEIEGHWLANEDGGAILLNSSPRAGRDMTIVSSPPWEGSEKGVCPHFDGSADYAYASDFAYNTTYWSASCWFNSMY